LLLRRIVEARLDPGGFAIDPLPAHAPPTGMFADGAIGAKVNHKSAGNPLLRGYHAHGVNSCFARPVINTALLQLFTP